MFVFSDLPKLVQQHIFSFLPIRNQLKFRQLNKYLYKTLKITNLNDTLLCSIVPVSFLASNCCTHIKSFLLKNTKYTKKDIKYIFTLDFITRLNEFTCDDVNIVISDDNMLKLKNVINFITNSVFNGHMLTQFTKLEYLYVTKVHIDFNYIKHLTSLQQLVIYKSDISDFSVFPNLKRLVLFKNNELSDNSFKNLNLEDLALCQCNSYVALEKINSLPKLAYLSANKKVLESILTLKFEFLHILYSYYITTEYIDALSKNVNRLKITIKYNENVKMTGRLKSQIVIHDNNNNRKVIINTLNCIDVQQRCTCDEKKSHEILLVIR